MVSGGTSRAPSLCETASLSQRLPVGRATDRVQEPSTAQPEEPTHGLGLVRRGDGASAPTASAYHSSLDAGNFREEPGAGKPHARICEGKAEWPSYSTTILADADAGVRSARWRALLHDL